jgi:endogenous inhibitor of DNA gyrase (YacG/DUF329 family)
VTNETETTPTVKTCPYCGWTFNPTARHASEKVLPYCSLGCRRLSEEKHVVYEAKHVEIVETLEREMAEARAAQADMSEALADLPEGVAERLREFFWGWCRLSPPARDVLALRFAGLSYADAGRVRGTSTQAAHKLVAEAAGSNSVVRTFAGRAEPESDTGATGQLNFFENE